MLLFASANGGAEKKIGDEAAAVCRCQSQLLTQEQKGEHDIN
ncbi:MAG: hypothetical protein JWO95_766, partial [Verrucomicrobiales bacterium]|nr:hypothetical protein [Verrucomicrobiales bacterium]